MRLKLHAHYFYESIDLSKIHLWHFLQFGIIGPAVAGLPDLQLRLCSSLLLVSLVRSDKGLAKLAILTNQITLQI